MDIEVRPRGVVLFGDARTALRELPEETADCCVTSPPYYGLRDYGVDGQIGLEESPEEYIRNLVEVFDGVWRVLKEDGTLWVVIGDSYARNPSKGGLGPNGKQDYIPQHCNARKRLSETRRSSDGAVGRADRAAMRVTGGDGVKEKDLLGMPWTLALALRSRGWYLRSDIIWHKPNPLPASVTDRCTCAHEYIFMLSKSSRYYYDAEIVREQSEDRTLSSWSDRKDKEPPRRGDPAKSKHKTTTDSLASRPGRNRRDVWTVPLAPYKGAHFATYPPKLIEPCILAGSRWDGYVLDPFLGSGTTAEVAVFCGRQYMGVEINRGNWPLIKARLGDD